MMHLWSDGIAFPATRDTGASAWLPADLAKAAHDAVEAENDRRMDEVNQAYDDGFAAGLADGVATERARLQSSMRALDEAVEVFGEASAGWTSALEENIAALAVAIARLIVDRELTSDTGIVRGLVAQALTEYTVDEPVQVRLNPDDLSALRATIDDDGAGELATKERCQWVADPHVVPGGCILQGRQRIIDGRVDTALERVYRRLVRQHA
ncbi:MAG: hypothetical protein IT356_06235 [Gemmatimonadaceae bacterium]|nr:hypothetical protein [Gemmatimonadaceae bacterium]